MNKQDKIKKVMREFKDGKLKTPNGRIVTMILLVLLMGGNSAANIVMKKIDCTGSKKNF